MESYGKQQAHIIQAVQKLQEASLQLGMTEDDVIALLGSGIKIADLLGHLETMLLDRAN